MQDKKSEEKKNLIIKKKMRQRKLQNVKNSKRTDGEKKKIYI